MDGTKKVSAAQKKRGLYKINNRQFKKKRGDRKLIMGGSKKVWAIEEYLSAIQKNLRR